MTFDPQDFGEPVVFDPEDDAHTEPGDECRRCWWDLLLTGETFVDVTTGRHVRPPMDPLAVVELEELWCRIRPPLDLPPSPLAVLGDGFTRADTLDEQLTELSAALRDFGNQLLTALGVRRLARWLSKILDKR